MYLKNIFGDGELEEPATAKDFLVGLSGYAALTRPTLLPKLRRVAGATSQRFD